MTVAAVESQRRHSLHYRALVVWIKSHLLQLFSGSLIHILLQFLLRLDRKPVLHEIEQCPVHVG